MSGVRRKWWEDFVGQREKIQSGKFILKGAASSMVILAMAPTIHAQAAYQSTSEETSIEIPAGPLMQSLSLISEGFDTEVRASPDLVIGKSAPAIFDATSAEEALRRALAGSELAVTAKNDAFVIVKSTDEDRLIESSRSASIDSDESFVPGDEIVVTGRFQQSLINRIPIDPKELPFSFNVVDRDFLDQRGNIRAIDALANLPNVTISRDFFNSGAPQFLTRGFFASVLVNNRAQSFANGAGFRDDSFVDRYEVLKGPTSISLGPVLPGGIINTVTKSPELEPFIAFDLSTDQFGSFSGEFDLNSGALFDGDIVRARLSGAYRNIGFDDDVTNREVFAIRPVLDFVMSDRTSAQLSFSYRKIQTVPTASFPLFNDGSVPSAFSTDLYLGFDNSRTDGEDIYIEGEFNHAFLDNLKLTLRGSHQNSRLDYQNTSGFFNYLYNDELSGISPDNPVVYTYSWNGSFNDDNTFIDAQLSYDVEIGGRRQDFVVGVAYIESEVLRPFAFGQTFGPLNIFDESFPVLPATPLAADFSPFVDDDSQLFSVFAEAAVRPTDWLSVIGGVRYDDFEVVSRGFRGVPTNRSDVTFRLGATASVSETVNIYASFAESFVPQGGRLRSGDAVGPETAVSYELGMKGALFNDVVEYRAALFNTVRNNIAVNDPTNIRGVENFVVPIGEQTNRGFEAVADVKPFVGANINLSYGFVDVERAEEANQSLVLATPPKHTFSAFGAYQFQDGPLQGFTVGGGPRFQSDREAVRDGVEIDGFMTVDMLASYSMTENLEIQFNVLNLSDERYLESIGDVGGLSGEARFGPPRTFVFTLRTRL
ncbi:MAG: TonB-dependent receptor [Pseudomonadota bacterium]